MIAVKDIVKTYKTGNMDLTRPETQADDRYNMK
jgi:hypothetical protein